jgi:hypothetical protein
VDEAKVWQGRAVERTATLFIDAWLDWLFERHQRDLTFQELRRSVQALSAAYVERRKLNEAPRALDSKGKRAAFACFFAPLHFLLVQEIIRALEAVAPRDQILDLGCGSLGAGLAWGMSLEAAPTLEGVDANRWAVGEARHNLDFSGLRGRVRVDDMLSVRFPAGRAGIVAAFAVNELQAPQRAHLLERVVAAGAEGASILVVEPIARTLTAGWWSGWETEVVRRGGRSDTWRFPVSLPRRLQEIDRAAGLNHRELKARSLWLAGSAIGSRSMAAPLV